MAYIISSSLYNHLESFHFSDNTAHDACNRKVWRNINITKHNVIMSERYKSFHLFNFSAKSSWQYYVTSNYWRWITREERASSETLSLVTRVKALVSVYVSCTPAGAKRRKFREFHKPHLCRNFSSVFFCLCVVVLLDQELIQYRYSSCLLLLLLLLLLWHSSSKNESLSRFKSDRGEILQDCSNTHRSRMSDMTSYGAA